jgi:hypothetical protein
VARRGFGVNAPVLSQKTRAIHNQARDDVLAELAQHLVAASRRSKQPAPEAAPGTELVRKNPAEVQRVRAGVERSLRIEAGRRARRLPYLATAAIAASGYAAWGTTELAAALAGPAGQTAATAGTVSICAATLAATLAAMRIAYRHGIDGRWQRSWWTAGLSAASWVSTAAAIGPASWPMTAALAAGAAAVSAGWLRAHEVPPTFGTPRALGPLATEHETRDTIGDVLAARWAATVAVKGGIVPGALLTDQTDLPNAIRWTIQTVPGTAEFAELLNRKGKIASGLQLSNAHVIIEPGDNESEARLTIITRDLLAAGVPYPGPRYEAGKILIGPYSDGLGQAEFYAYDEVGVRNGLASGSPGSGKSGFLEIVALALRASGEWYVVFGDGDPSGGSSPLLNRTAHWPDAGPRQALMQLEAIEEALAVRTMLKSQLTLGPDGKTPVPITDPTTQLPIREMIPCPQYPGIMWILDELHRLTKDPFLIDNEFAERLERITRLGRKYGIGVIAGTQSLLAGDFGGNTPLRGYLSSRNLFAFRSTNKSETATVQGLEIAPGVLPEGGGYAFSGGDGRLSMLRVAWTRDMSPFMVGLPEAVLDSDTDLAFCPFRPATPLDPAAQFAAQSARLAAWRTAQRIRGSDRTGVNRDRTGSGADRTGTSADRTGTGPFDIVGLADLVVPAALTAANVIPIRRTGPARSGPVDEGPDLDALRPPHRAVYEALRGGLRRSGDIVEKTGLRPPAVSKALRALEDYELARKIAHGEWEPTAEEQGA